MTFRFFIAYADDDGEIMAQRIEKYLSKRGYDPFLAKKLLFGDNWRVIIDSKIQKCDFFILVLTPAALESAEVKREIMLANQFNKRKIILKHNYVEEGWKDLPFDLGQYQGADFADKDQMILELTRGIKLLIGNIQPASSQEGNKLFFEGKYFEVPVKILNGTIMSTTIDPDNTSLLMNIRTNHTRDGILEIQLPRTLIDYKTDANDDQKFIVIVDGEEVDFAETDTTASDRTLKIPIAAGATEVEIIGTHVAGRTNIIFPEIQTDKEEYSRDDTIRVLVISPMDNHDPDEVEEIKVHVRRLRSDGSIASASGMTFRETAKNTGVFEGVIKLTSDPQVKNWDLLVYSDDTLEIEFLFSHNLKATKSIRIL